MPRPDLPRSGDATPLNIRPAVWWIPIGLIATAVIAVGAPLEAVLGGVPAALALAAAVLQGGSIALAALTPRIAIGLHLAAIAINGLAATVTGVPWPLSVIGLVALCFFVVALALRHPPMFAAGAWALSLGLLVAIALTAPLTGRELPGAFVDIIIAAAISIPVLVAATAVTARLRERGELAAVRRDVQLEQERRRNGEERARIAREMHDVVAHSMSAVHMRATSAPYRLGELDEPVREEFDAIADSARAALSELRQLLSVLRAGADEPAFAPQPRLDALDELIESTRQGGLEVRYVTTGDPRGVPAVVQLAGYRIVQEALSNAIRHAPGSRVSVAVQVAPDEVRLDVEDDGAVSPDVDADLAESAGHGLIGMSERVDALGGRLWVGPEPGGGFRVEARLPYSAGTGEAPSADAGRAHADTAEEDG